tara:strand:+ start:414 stop:947 length:534 start_codon:yes stop_codon:yes gene_type:complete
MKEERTLLEILDEVEFPKNSKYVFTKMGDEAKSMLFGITFNRMYKTSPELKKFQLTKGSIKYPELYNRLKEIIKIVNPDFDYNGITINKNCEAKPHKDGNNMGNGIIVGVGDYTGGDLCVLDEESKTIYVNDLKYNFLEFNGGKHLHWNTPILSGTKYTIIWFNNQICNKSNLFLNK